LDEDIQKSHDQDERIHSVFSAQTNITNDSLLCHSRDPPCTDEAKDALQTETNANALTFDENENTIINCSSDLDEDSDWSPKDDSAEGNNDTKPEYWVSQNINTTADDNTDDGDVESLAPLVEKK